MSFNDAAKAKGLPKETLCHWLQKTTGKQGSERKTILTKEEEEHILIMLVKCYTLAWPVELNEISLVIKSYFDSCGRKEARFKDNKLGEYWQISLRKWWRDHIRLRKPEVRTKARTQGLNEQTLKQFLDMYYNVLNGNGFFRDADAGQHIFNVNETGCLTHSNKRWLFFKNSPRAVFFSPQHVKSQCTLFLSVSLLQVNTCSP